MFFKFHPSVIHNDIKIVFQENRLDAHSDRAIFPLFPNEYCYEIRVDQITEAHYQRLILINDTLLLGGTDLFQNVKLHDVPSNVRILNQFSCAKNQ